MRSDVNHTFDVIVRTIGTWWPADTFSAGKGRVRDITVDRHAGGHVYETWDDGTTVEWGDVIIWDPSTRLTMSWRGTPGPTEVELTFQELGPSLTRVANHWRHSSGCFTKQSHSLLLVAAEVLWIAQSSRSSCTRRQGSRRSVPGVNGRNHAGRICLHLLSGPVYAAGIRRADGEAADVRDGDARERGETLLPRQSLAEFGGL